MDVFEVWVHLRIYLSVQAFGGTNVLYWKSSERQNSRHMALLKHHNNKTSLCKLSKNHWVTEVGFPNSLVPRSAKTLTLFHIVSPIKSRRLM